MTLDVQGVGWSVDAQTIIEDIQLTVEAGAFVGLLGPNGSGKSTLLRCVYRSLKPDAGTISLEGESLLAMPPREAARRMAVVLQESQTQFDFTVQESVDLGHTNCPQNGGIGRQIERVQRRHLVDCATIEHQFRAQIDTLMQNGPLKHEHGRIHIHVAK